MKKSRPQSPLIRRLLYFWLPLAALLLGMGYFSQARYNPAKEAKAGLDRLNYWRTQAGLQPLAPNCKKPPKTTPNTSAATPKATTKPNAATPATQAQTPKPAPPPQDTAQASPKTSPSATSPAQAEPAPTA